MIQVSYEALKKRYDQGWLLEIIDDLDRLMERIKEARQRQEVSCLNNWLRTRRKNHKITFFFCTKSFGIGRFPWQRGGRVGIRNYS